MNTELTDRQQRELDYHKEHAKKHLHILDSPFDWSVLDNPKQRWWNGYWKMYAHLTNYDLHGKRVLIVGCGFGDDALRIAKLGAIVSAFDLSPECIEIAKGLAQREGLDIDFQEMPCEVLRYPDASFD
ncbi:MAG: class I SAM-dependent methyltransferase, partial [Candidatus Methylumidiphilus sp.]